MPDNGGSDVPQRRWISGGVVVAAVPFVGYLVAFLFEAGYTRAYKIPSDFITVSISSIFVSMLALLGVAALMGLTSNLMQGVPVVRFQAVRDDDFKDHPISVRFIKTEPVQLILLLILFIALQDWHFIPWAVFGGILAWILYLFVYPLRRRDDGYRQKLRAQDAADDRFNGFNARINSLLRRGYYGPASVAIATLFGAYYAGTYWALQTRNFPVVTPSNPPLVVLRVYGDTLIARRLQADQHSLGGEIVVWRLGETRLVLERRDFGSLRVAD